MSLKKWFAASALMIGMTTFPIAFANANDNGADSDMEKNVPTAMRADAKSANAVESFNIPVRDFLELSKSTDKGENSRAASTLHSAIYRLISLHETKPLRQPRTGETVSDVMNQQGEIARWMRGYYGPMMNPDLGSYKETLRHIYEANPNQSLYGAIMGHVIDSIRYQQNLTAQKKQSTPQP